MHVFYKSAYLAKNILNTVSLKIKDLVFDFSGSYLACAGTDVRIFQVKNWDVLKVIGEHTALATGVRFGLNAKSLVTCSLDRSLKLYSI